MIWIVIVAVIVFAVFKILSAFKKDLKKDSLDLNGIELSEKFSVIVDMLNEVAFHNKGIIIKVDNKEFKLYGDGQNKIIYFLYGAGHLTITWKHKYLQKEVVYKKALHNARNISIEEQEKFCKDLVIEMSEVIKNHQNKVGLLGDM